MIKLPFALLSVITQRTATNQPNAIIVIFRRREGLPEFPSCNEELIGRYFAGFQALHEEC